jgi:hypothetical protein
MYSDNGSKNCLIWITGDKRPLLQPWFHGFQTEQGPSGRFFTLGTHATWNGKNQILLDPATELEWFSQKQVPDRSLLRFPSSHIAQLQVSAINHNTTLPRLQLLVACCLSNRSCRQSAKMSAPFDPPAALEYAINHVFLPPKTPQKDDTGIVEEHHLIDSLLESAKKFCEECSTAEAKDLGLVIRMLERLLKVKPGVESSTKRTVMKTVIQELSNGGMHPLILIPPRVFFLASPLLTLAMLQNERCSTSEPRTPACS